jgi:hypothetical protein
VDQSLIGVLGGTAWLILAFIAAVIMMLAINHAGKVAWKEAKYKARARMMNGQAGNTNHSVNIHAHHPNTQPSPMPFNLGAVEPPASPISTSVQSNGDIAYTLGAEETHAHFSIEHTTPSQPVNNPFHQYDPYRERTLTPQPAIQSLNPSDGIVPNLGGVAQAVMAQVTDPTKVCAVCGQGFGAEYTGKTWVCSVCKAVYHEDCLHMQVNSEGTCKQCNVILLC